MDIERKNSTFIRDILVKIVLIVLFIFLLMFLFPMPNLTTFYDSVFNNNVQNMKDAAEKWFTKERMPKEVGDEEKLTLQDMLDKKLVLPFLDKDGKECDTKKSYVTVKKEENEYTLKVYLSCNGKSDYIIEPIGCYDFCPDGNCNQTNIETDENTGNVTVKVPDNKTDNTGKTSTTPTTPTDNPKYKLQYLYTRTTVDGKWTTGDYQDSKERESSTVKLVNTRSLYTGQKKITKGTTLYKHVKYDYRDSWTYDTDWTDEVKTLSDNLKLVAKRTLYTGQKLVEETLYKYKHIKYGYKDNWKILDYSTTKRTTSETVVLLDTRYTVRRTIKRTIGSWSNWIEDTTWRTSKPADTSTKQWTGPSKTKVTTSWKTIYNSYKSIGQPLPTYSGDRWYEELYSQDEPCQTSCNGKTTVRVYYYRVHEKQYSYSYLYKYRTYSETTTTEVDEKVVSDATSYVKQGYTIVKTEYKYKINEREKYIVDVKWTTSKTPDPGYEYANETMVVSSIRYVDLGKWVTSRSKLGEYVYNIKERTQYKYRYNNPEKYISDTIWTTSINPPSGYTYTGENKTENKTTYADLGKWVTSKSELGEYTYNIEKKTQYKYKRYSSVSKTESKWFDSNPGGDWVYANQTRKIKIN